jgi:hypothetical protein
VGRIEELAERYAGHIRTPWQRTVAGAQRVIMVVYDKELERTLRARRTAFENATRESGHAWREVDVTDAFARWIAADEYREPYFESPEDLQLKLEAEFADYVTARIREALTGPDLTESSVLAVLGVGALYGFTRVSKVLKLVRATSGGAWWCSSRASTSRITTAYWTRGTAGTTWPYRSPFTEPELPHEGRRNA